MTLKTKEPVHPLVRIRDAAKLLSVCPATVHSLIQSGDLEASKITPSKKKRQHVRITCESLSAFYQKRFGKNLDFVFESPFKPATK